VGKLRRDFPFLSGFFLESKRQKIKLKPLCWGASLPLDECPRLFPALYIAHVILSLSLSLSPAFSYPPSYSKINQFCFGSCYLLLFRKSQLFVYLVHINSHIRTYGERESLL